MFREIRKKVNEIGLDESKELLKNSRRGIFATSGDDDYPYTIPINYLYDEGNQKIYFHGSKAGHKVDSIKRSNKVCFTVYGNETIEDESWAPFVQSVIVFGRCHLIDNQPRAMELLKTFAMKYYPSEGMVDKKISLAGKAVQMYEIDIEHMSGKRVQER